MAVGVRVDYASIQQFAQSAPESDNIVATISWYLAGECWCAPIITCIAVWYKACISWQARQGHGVESFSRLL